MATIPWAPLGNRPCLMLRICFDGLTMAALPALPSNGLSPMPHVAIDPDPSRMPECFYPATTNSAVAPPVFARTGPSVYYCEIEDRVTPAYPLYVYPQQYVLLKVSMAHAWCYPTLSSTASRSCPPANLTSDASSGWVIEVCFPVPNCPHSPRPKHPTL